MTHVCRGSYYEDLGEREGLCQVGFVPIFMDGEELQVDVENGEFTQNRGCG